MGLLAAAAAGAVVLTGCGGTSTDTGPLPAARPQPAPAAAVRKVLVVVEENHSLQQMRTGMPYTWRLARRYGYAGDYRAISHPSLPNYLAISGGSTFGVTDDGPPSEHRVPGRSVFGQAIADGRTAAVYADGMPTRCDTGDSGAYAVKHNPWAYFVQERRLCRAHDLPMSAFGRAVRAGRLPQVGMLVPDLQHDAHDGSLAQADDWFRRRMAAVFRGPDWRSGHLAVVLTADEDDDAHDNRVLTVVIHPSQRHHVIRTRLDHYSLTRLYDEVAGLPLLRRAAGAPSLSRAAGLPQ